MDWKNLETLLGDDRQRPFKMKIAELMAFSSPLPTQKHILQYVAQLETRKFGRDNDLNRLRLYVRNGPFWSNVTNELNTSRAKVSNGIRGASRGWYFYIQLKEITEEDNIWVFVLRVDLKGETCELLFEEK